MVIDADKHGIGDLCITAWISQANPELLHHATGAKAQVLELFSQKVVPRCSGMINTFESYKYELANPHLPRLETRARQLGFQHWARPPVNLDDEYRQWAKGQHKRPLVMLFPLANRKERCWPLAYWLDLANSLEASGLATMTCIPARDDSFINFPETRWEGDWRRIAGLMLSSALVICNESGPAHIAGGLNVKTLTVCGPTKNKGIFAHLPTVELISADLACVGCMFSGAFRPACEIACSALLQLPVSKVLNRALTILEA